MQTSDELWPPFGPGAEFRQASRRERQPADRRAQQADRRQRPALTREEIVAAAMDIADREGAEAVSMRRIAQVLHAGAMSLYWHLASKEHLLELMLDELFAEIVVPEPTGDWSADLREQARSMRAVFLRHKWATDFIGARPALGPNTLRNLDKMLAILDGLAIDMATAMNILQTVGTYVSGAVIREFQEIRTQREEERYGADWPEFQGKLSAWTRRLAETGMFDHFLKMLNDDVDPDAEDTRDERFEFGLDCVLEGIAAKLRVASA